MMNTTNLRYTTPALLCLLLTVTVTTAAVAEADDRPDLSGTYDVATVTPLQRPRAFGNNLLLSPEAAEKIMADVAAAKAPGSRTVIQIVLHRLPAVMGLRALQATSVAITASGSTMETRRS